MKTKNSLIAAIVICAAAAQAAPPKDPPSKCASDAVLAGSTCVDKYEASVWYVPDPVAVNAKLVKNIRKGKADMDDLTAGGATQLGTASDDYGGAGCLDHGAGCNGAIYAVSLPGVTPSAHMTWFQAAIACASSGKRLPSNAEWQRAVTGSPDPGPDNGTTDCRTASGFSAVPTGSRGSCVSAFGAFDMVGNLSEWVADWLPRSTTCGTWSGSGDQQCLAGAATTGEPGALLRGGRFGDGSGAGPVAVGAGSGVNPSWSTDSVGFRCAR